jgi:hypothetical protein
MDPIDVANLFTIGFSLLGDRLNGRIYCGTGNETDVLVS